MRDGLRGWVAGLLLGGAVLAWSAAAQAALFTFSFQNVQGAVAGTVTGTIVLPDGDGVFAASSVTVDSAPAAMAYAVGSVFDSTLTTINQFTVLGGNIILSGTSFLGVFPNVFTGLGLHASVFGGASWLDVLNASNTGLTGVRDADSSTLTFAAAVPEPASLGLFALAGLGLAGVSALRRRGSA